MKRLHALLLFALLALSAWLVSRHRAAREAVSGESAAVKRGQSSRTASVEQLALPGAALIASLDLEALRGNVWGRAALEQLLPSEAKAEACTRKVLDDVQRLLLTVPSSSSIAAEPEFAVLAAGRLRATPVLECASRLLRARSGEPTPSRSGAFQCLRDRKGQGELAVRDGGPLILSGGGYFRALLERATGAPPESGSREALHVALRRELGSAPLQLSWVLPAGWLETWLEDPAVKSSPLADVRAVSLSGALDDVISLAATIRAENQSSAARIESFLDNARVDFSGFIDAYLGPGAAQQIRISRSGPRIELTLRLATRSLAARWLGEASAPGAAPSATAGGVHSEQPERGGKRAQGSASRTTNRE